jgi:ABC-2 type transport system permease protein
MIGVEFSKQILRLRTYVLLGLMAGLPALLTIVFKIQGAPAHPQGPGPGFVDLATNSGANMALASLGHAGPMVLPIVVAILAGSAIPEEANWRTLGYLLLRPISRGRFLLSKLTVVVALVLVAALLISAASVIAGLVAFGWRPVETPAGTTVSAEAALLRVAIATLYLAWGMAAVASVSFFVSVTANAPLSAVASGFGLVIVSQLLDSFSAMGSIRNLLPTHYWRAWEDLFASPLSIDDMVGGIVLQAPYVVVFLALSWWWFRRKDILT